MYKPFPQDNGPVCNIALLVGADLNPKCQVHCRTQAKKSCERPTAQQSITSIDDTERAKCTESKGKDSERITWGIRNKLTYAWTSGGNGRKTSRMRRQESKLTLYA